MDDLKGLIMVLKRKSDSGMPKSVVDLKERWEKVRYRSELTYREHLTEQEYDENKVASVLLLHDPEAQPSTSTDCVASASASPLFPPPPPQLSPPVLTPALNLPQPLPSAAAQPTTQKIHIFHL